MSNNCIEVLYRITSYTPLVAPVALFEDSQTVNGIQQFFNKYRRDRKIHTLELFL